MHERTPGRTFQIIEPTRQPKDVVFYRETGPGTVDPVTNAERQIEFLSDEFQAWLDDDNAELVQAWALLKAAPADPGAFLRFHKAVHTVSGNSAILKCEIAGRLAAPLARWLERTPNIEDHTEIIDTAVSAISAALSGKTDETDPRLEEIQEGLKTIVTRWIAHRR